MTRQHIQYVVPFVLVVGCTEANPQRVEPTAGDTLDTGSSDGGEASTGASTATTAAAETGEGTTGTDDTSPADESSSSEGAPRPCDGVCVVAPDGWNGPVLLASADDEPAACSDGVYGQLQVAGYGGVIAPDATCDCECGIDESVVCDPFTTLYRHDVAACNDAPASILIEVGCNDISNQPAGYFEWTIGVSGGACDASASVVVPPFGFSEQLAACGSTDVASGACEDDGACVPSPGEVASLCWWSEGDVACPESLSGRRELVYTEPAIDGRGCEECSCAEPEGWCEHAGLVLVGANETCDASDVNPPPVGVGPDECNQYASGVHSVLMPGDPTPHTTCSPAAMPAPTGTVEPQHPITVCCGG